MPKVAAPLVDDVTIEALALELGLDPKLISLGVWLGYDPAERRRQRPAGFTKLAQPEVAAVQAWLRTITAETDWYRWATEFWMGGEARTFHAVGWIPDTRDKWRLTGGTSTRDKMLVTLCGLRSTPERKSNAVTFTAWHARDIRTAFEAIRLSQHGYLPSSAYKWTRCAECEAIATAGGINVEW